MTEIKAIDLATRWLQTHGIRTRIAPGKDVGFGVDLLARACARAQRLNGIRVEITPEAMTAAAIELDAPDRRDAGGALVISLASTCWMNPYATPPKPRQKPEPLKYSKRHGFITKEHSERLRAAALKGNAKQKAAREAAARAEAGE